MTVQETIRYGYTVLRNTGVETPFLDATLLLGESLSLTKEQLLSSYPEPVSENDFARFEQYLEERIKGCPISYIRKKKEFFSLDFYVDHRVFVPRPDTEILVEAVIDLIKRNPAIKTVHDVCTGSGCIAITLKHELPRLKISASDTSEKAGEVFLYNSITILGWILPFLRKDLLSDIKESFDLIVSNPPYLTEMETEEMKRNDWPEPAIALNGGPDGLDVCRKIIIQSLEKLNPGGFLAMEAAFNQMKILREEMHKAGFVGIEVHEDLAGRERAIIGRKPIVEAENGSQEESAFS